MRFLTGAVLILVTGLLHADLTSELTACSSISDDRARLSCFDALVSDRGGGETKAAIPATARAGRSYPDGHGGEVYFPLGDLSFADEVVSFESGRPAAKMAGDRNPREVLGVPDYSKTKSDGYLTLGCGGTLVIRFNDNSLVDLEGPDLYVFEIGPAVEPTLLAISQDGETWLQVGKIAGGRADVDIGGIADASTPFPYVRLTDGRSDCGGQWPGADIDAVGAIGSGFKVQLDSSVLFDSGKATLRPGATRELAKVLDMLDQQEAARVVIEGHTDDVGSDESNQVLSVRRAEAVAGFLIESGKVEAERIASKGYGETSPVAPNTSAEGRQRNRRVEITVIP